ncbi:hypothetical protein KC336_g18535, partial [Hortaea werneckii]
MKFLNAFFAITALATTVLADAVPFERLNKTDALLLVLDLQDGLYGLARDFDPTVYYNAMIAHAAIGKLFDLPVILSTSAQTERAAPQGDPGDVSRRAVGRATGGSGRVGQCCVPPGGAGDGEEADDCCRDYDGRLKVVYIHPLTSPPSSPHSKGTTFLALSLRAEGYGVWANVEASGTTTEFIRDVSNDRMARAGVQLVSLFAIICDLMRDWRASPGADTVIPWLAKYYPV